MTLTDPTVPLELKELHYAVLLISISTQSVVDTTQTVYRMSY